MLNRAQGFSPPCLSATELLTTFAQQKIAESRCVSPREHQFPTQPVPGARHRGVCGGELGSGEGGKGRAGPSRRGTPASPVQHPAPHRFAQQMAAAGAGSAPGGPAPAPRVPAAPGNPRAAAE